LGPYFLIIKAAGRGPHGCGIPVFAARALDSVRPLPPVNRRSTGQVVPNKFRVLDGTEGVRVTQATGGIWP
jgi:hypothetical protein